MLMKPILQLLDLLQTNPVKCIADWPSFLMCLTRICDYPYETNICKFTALLYFCPHACYLTPLICGGLTLNSKISGTVGYRNAFRNSKNIFILIQLGTVPKHFVSLCHHQTFIIPMVFAMHHLVRTFTK